MRVVNTRVTYADVTDVIFSKSTWPIREIEWDDIMNHHMVEEAEVLILVKDGEYKVLKSRW